MIHKDFPVLKELCERLAAATGRKLFSSTFCEDVRKAPYGAGGTQIILALAHVIRAYGERLIVYQDSTKMVEQPIQSYEDLVEMLRSFQLKRCLQFEIFHRHSYTLLIW